MKIPSQIVTRHKVRDAMICIDYLENKPKEEIARRNNLTVRQIDRILYANRAVLILNKEYEKVQRIHWLKSKLKKYDDDFNKSIQIIDRLHTEIEGDKPLVDNSQHVTQIIYTRKKNDTRNRNELRSPELSG